MQDVLGQTPSHVRKLGLRLLESSPESGERNIRILRMDVTYQSPSVSIASNIEANANTGKSTFTLLKVPCRYGIGCTHIHDPIHLERFTHPPIPILERKFSFLFILSSFYFQRRFFEIVICVVNVALHFHLLLNYVIT